MAFQFCSLSSGSNGNCYLIKNDTSALLIDAGISGKKIFEGIDSTDTPYENIKGLLITHEHHDHIQSLPIVTKKLPHLKVYANEITWDNITRPVPDEQKSVFSTGEDFYIDDFKIRPFHTPHDAAEPVGFSIFYRGRQLSLVTDAGCITDEIFNEITDADLLLLEANHEKEMLLMGDYPYDLKCRILSENGHLSNVSAGECLCRLAKAKNKERRVLLGHLSEKNNDPSMAILAVKNTLMENNIIPGDELKLDVVSRDCRSCIYDV